MEALGLHGWDRRSIWGYAEDPVGGYYLALLWSNDDQPGNRHADIAIDYRDRIPSPAELAVVIARRTDRPLDEVEQAMGQAQARGASWPGHQ